MNIRKNPLKRYLKENRLRQRELAARLGLTDGALSKYLRGNLRFKYSTAKRVSRVTGIDVLELLEAGERRINA